MEDPSLPGKQTERPNPELDSTYDYKLPRRLVVCLDGSWNKRDSGTNVYHISNLVQEGRIKDPKTGQEWFQIIYYDEGVGTGVLDSVSGGGFGIGLSENIRQAYDWLVEKYRDAKEGRPADEIYVFGFSRGAFTARSLIGLIAKCGLVCRGAPMSPEELWAGYQLLGRQTDPRSGGAPTENWWERLTGGAPKIPFRSLWELKRDDWETDRAEPIEPPKNLAEELLVTWSRRVRIRCVGIIDTVGAMGVDMLAIPWLREKTARFHDTQLSAMVQNGFHALGIDEHRANFVHIPWRRSTKRNWPDDGKIEQRWFVGAHSNVGGGYDDNVLAQFPLAWLLRECRDLGLVLRAPATAQADPLTPPPLDSCLPLLLPVKGNDYLRDTPPRARDSFAEIARGIWQGLIRSKREYRRIGPPPEFQNGLRACSAAESIDPSVSELIAEEYKRAGTPARYNPPNLWEFWERTETLPDPLPPGYAKPKHQYIEKNLTFCGWLGGWLIGVAAAAAALARLNGVHGYSLLWPALIAMGCGFLLDWRESAMNHAVTLEPDGVRAERRNAVLTLAVLFRLIILGAIIFGLFYWIVWLWPWLLCLDQSGHLWWLLALDGLLIYCGTTSGWCAAPMQEAGFGSIVDLQTRRNPRLVSEWLDKWGKIEGRDAERRQWLMPIAHTIYRDMFAYIPAYGFALFVGNAMALLCLPSHLALREDCLGILLRNWPAWYFYVIMGCVLADYLEDGMHLYYIKKYPKPPSAKAVFVGFGATIAKFVFLAAASVGFLTAIICLTWDQMRAIWKGQTGGLSLFAVILTALLCFPPVKSCVSWLGKKIKTLVSA